MIRDLEAVKVGGSIKQRTEIKVICCRAFSNELTKYNVLDWKKSLANSIGSTKFHLKYVAVDCTRFIDSCVYPLCFWAAFVFHRFTFFSPHVFVAMGSRYSAFIILLSREKRDKKISFRKLNYLDLFFHLRPFWFSVEIFFCLINRHFSSEVLEITLARTIFLQNKKKITKIFRGYPHFYFWIKFAKPIFL